MPKKLLDLLEVGAFGFVGMLSAILGMGVGAALFELIYDFIMKLA